MLFPDEDASKDLEWPGGCEDPRLVESPDGGYVCTYSAFDGGTSRLCVATSDDLRRWVKHGPAFGGGRHGRRWSKSGSIVTEVRDGRLVAARTSGRYFMYWGEGTCFAATSPDLVRWTPLEFDADADRSVAYDPARPGGPWRVTRLAAGRVLRPVLFPRRGRFDELLVEPGPPAVVTPSGVVLVVNGARLTAGSSADDVAVAYSPGQVLFDPCDLTAPVGRDLEPTAFGGPASDLRGQVHGVRFAEALVRFEGSWHLYYGMGDSRIGCATAPAA